MSAMQITNRNVNYILEDALYWLKTAGTLNDSRNGTVIAAPGPVLTTYLEPRERVLFSPERDANPFFHLMEAVWMLAGRNDVALPAHYAAQLKAYSDDGSTLWGAYGYRWRQHFEIDQILAAIHELRENPLSRRVVIAMWDASCDLAKAKKGGKDVPCNTHIYFDGTRGKLDMTVCCRSNDAIWGAYGANAVHFSVLQEFVALAARIPIGVMYQLSNNLHIYTEVPAVKRLFNAERNDVLYAPNDRYASGAADVMPLMEEDQLEHGYRSWLAEARFFCEGEARMACFTHPFFRDVMLPMRASHTAYKNGHIPEALDLIDYVAASDWRIAAREWLQRRAAK